MSTRWVEVLPSREWTLDRRNISKNLTFLIYTDDPDEWVDAAEEVEFNGITMLLDDNIVNKEIFKTFSPYIPTFLLFPFDEDVTYMLTLSSIKCTMVSWDCWKIETTFDIPDDGGQSGGSTGLGSIGASDGENNSNEFTQITFNGTLQPVNVQMDIVREVTKSDFESFEDFEVPAHIAKGKAVFIGESDEGILGAEEYEGGFSFGIIQYMPPSKLTYNYMRSLTRLLGKLNDNTFFGLAKGSVRFMAYSGQGDLYQNTPVTLEFEVRTNFKFIDAIDDIQAPVDDTITGEAPNKQVTIATQFDQRADPQFPATTEDNGLPGGAGVHSGWSIVDYRRANVKDETNNRNYTLPWLRIIFLKAKYADFNKFRL